MVPFPAPAAPPGRTTPGRETTSPKRHATLGRIGRLGHHTIGTQAAQARPARRAVSHSRTGPPSRDGVGATPDCYPLPVSQSKRAVRALARAGLIKNLRIRNTSRRSNRPPDQTCEFRSHLLVGVMTTSNYWGGKARSLAGLTPWRGLRLILTPTCAPVPPSIIGEVGYPLFTPDGSPHTL